MPDLRPILNVCHGALRPGGWIAFTVFKGDIDPVAPTSSGDFLCFAHHPNHVRRAAAAVGLSVEAFEEGTHEVHDGTPVTALVVGLKRQE